MSATVDANVLIYAADTETSMGAAAHELIERLARGFLQAYESTAPEVTRGRQVPDAHIAALMRQHGVRTIYTRDRDFRRFDGIAVEDPFVA
jgi:uncharacterized protein